MRALRRLAFLLLKVVTIDHMAIGLYIFLPVLMGWLFVLFFFPQGLRIDPVALKKSTVLNRSSHLKTECHHVTSCNLLLCKKQSFDHCSHTESKSNEDNRITTIGQFSKSMLSSREVCVTGRHCWSARRKNPVFIIHLQCHKIQIQATFKYSDWWTAFTCIVVTVRF